MANFQTKANLPRSTQDEIDRIQAIASGQRTTPEANFLTSLAPYLTNGVDLLDSDGLIAMAHGYTLPTGLSGFAKSSIFRKTNVATGEHAIYENTGDSDSAVWDSIGQASGEEVQIDELAPVNAVNALATLTADTVVAGVYAESVVTASTVIDGDTFTIGAVVYRAKTTPAQAFDVALGASDAVFLDNMKLAINASGVGDGSDYYAGTTAHPDVIATTNTDTTQKIVSRVSGTANNAKATTSTGGTLTWEDTTLGGGTGSSVAGVAGNTVTVDDVTYTIESVLGETIDAELETANQVLYGSSDATVLDNLKSAINGTAGEGTTYATGTAQPSASVNASTNTATTQVVEADVAGEDGDGTCAVSATGGLSWDVANIEGGVNGTVGDKGQQYINASYIFTAIDDNTIVDKNWRRVSLGSAY